MSMKSLSVFATLLLTSTLLPVENKAQAALVTILNNSNAQDVLVCDGANANVNCLITVTVTDKKKKKCKLDIDKPVVVLTAGSDMTYGLNLVWKLVNAPGSTETYKFDLGNGVDVAGDANDDFKDGVADSDTQFRIARDKSKPSKKAFNYSIAVLKKVGSEYFVCNVIDPIIVNRD